MKSAFLSVLAIAFAASTLVGCSQRIGDFTMVTTKNYEKDKKYKMVGRMTGEDMPLVILIIPLGTPNMKTATDHAIEAGNGVYLANAVVETAWWSAILVSSSGYRVTGDVYAPADQGDLMNPAIEKFELRDTKSGLAMVSVNDGHSVKVQDYASLTK
jgi:hypothetical protein